MQQAAESHQQLLSRGVLASAVGVEVGRMLDYLSKELVRCAAAAAAAAAAVLIAKYPHHLHHFDQHIPSPTFLPPRSYKEERRLAAMVMLAERQRRMREVGRTLIPACSIHTANP